MWLPDNNLTRKEAHLAALVAIGLLLFLFEAFIPRPVPWLKFGIANIATLIALYWYGAAAALLVALSRILIGAIFTGNILTPGFLLSFSGGLSALLAMIFFYQLRIFGVWGISLMGAAFHNVGQIAAGYFILFKNPVILRLLPYLLFYSFISGTVVALIAYEIIKRLKTEFLFS